MDYYSVDDILCEETKLACVFNTAAIGLGYLNERADSEDVELGAKVEIPFWLCSVLVSKNMVDPTLPRFFGERFKVKLLADPASVNLHDRCDYFYELGLKLALLIRESDGEEIVDMLQRALFVRFQQIIQRDPLYRSPDFSAFAAKLCSFERQLLDTKHASSAEHRQWSRRRGGRITASSAVGPSRKRRRRRG